jgi:subtilisin family serine protease
MEDKMKIEKKTVFNIVILLLVFTATTLFSSTLDFDQHNFNQLMRIASQKGFVRVIVQMDVPELQLLTERSNSFHTGFQKSVINSQPVDGAQSELRDQIALNADFQLDQAISRSRNEILLQLNGTQYRVSRSFKTIPYISMLVTSESLKRLRELPDVINITKEQRFPLPQPLVADGETRYGPKMMESNTIIGADTAWGMGYDGSGWYVAILDAGILKSHELFQGKDIQEHCFASGDSFDDREIGSCPNGKPEMHGPGAAMHYRTIYHGTHVSGIAVGNNRIDRFGIARGADLIKIQVFTTTSDSLGISAWGSDILYGIEYVYSIRNDYPIASINMSFGTQNGYDDFCTEHPMAAAIANLRAVGIAPVIASGNEWYCNAVGAPACVPDAVTVTASNKSDEAAKLGNWNDKLVNLVAPGKTINSATILSDTSYRDLSGTSMSAPFVAGAFALMKQFDPSLTVTEIVEVLQETGKMLTNTRCPGLQPKPRIDVGAAIIKLRVVQSPLNLGAEQVSNKSFLQTEYINVLTWKANPKNAAWGIGVSQYRIYSVMDGQLSIVAEVDSSTYSYQHRFVKKGNMTYAISSVNTNGEESPPHEYTTEFNL